MNVKKLLEKAKAGVITSDELDWVAHILTVTDHAYDPYTLIHILGRGNAVQYESLVARYLHCPSDPMLARIALLTLCNSWGKATAYLQDVIHFVVGVPWDRDQYVRLVALSILGEVLRHTQEPSLITLLATIYTDAAEEPIVQQAAYSALARAAGKEWNELPPASKLIDLKTKADPKVLAWLENYL